MPADPAHDADRGACLTNPDQTVLCPSQAQRLPFLNNPTSCTGPVDTVLHANSWQHPATSRPSPRPPRWAPSGCDAVPFDPSINVQSDSQSSDTPSGIAIDVNVPQPQNPTGIAESNLKKAVVTLPEGTSINPSVADGLGGCTEAQIGLDNTATRVPGRLEDRQRADHQPAAARSAAGRDLPGDVPNDNPFGSLLAIYSSPRAAA